MSVVADFEKTVSPQGIVDVKQLTSVPIFIKGCSRTINQLKGRGRDDDRGIVDFEIEKINFLNQIESNDRLKYCSPLSLYKCFIECIANGLSFAPAQKLNYLVPYGKEAKNEISGYGEAQMRIDQGVIAGYNDPVIVYDCDTFSTGVKDGKPFIDHIQNFPRPEGVKVIAAYVMIEHSSGRMSPTVFGMNEIDEFKAYALKKIDSIKSSNMSDAYRKKLKTEKHEQYAVSGFIKVKVLKHAMKRMPVRILGDQTALSSSQSIHEIDYQIEEEKHTPTIRQPEEPKTVEQNILQNPNKGEAF